MERIVYSADSCLLAACGVAGLAKVAGYSGIAMGRCQLRTGPGAAPSRRGCFRRRRIPVAGAACAGRIAVIAQRGDVIAQRRGCETSIVQSHRLTEEICHRLRLCNRLRMFDFVPLTLHRALQGGGGAVTLCGGREVVDRCPHCGAFLSVVRDAFCSECRGPLDEEYGQRGEPLSALEQTPSVAPQSACGNPLASFSFSARMVIVLALFLVLGGTAAYICWSHEKLPPGSYPLAFFLLPAIVAAGVFCVAGLALLRVCGVPIYHRGQSESSDGRGTTPAEDIVGSNKVLPQTGHATDGHSGFDA